MAKRPIKSGEDLLIARHFKPIARHPGAFGLTDDAAAITPPSGHELVLTADAIVAGVHFFPEDPPEAIAHKAIRVNLSDLAAKGAKPAGFLLSLALPKSVREPWLKRFAKALGADARRYRCPLFGGDTVYTPGPLMVSITAFGTLPGRSMVHRSGARKGDRVFVTGTIGDAALGLQLRLEPRAARRWKLATRDRAHLARRYLIPEPRNALADVIRKFASASMDVSDGLVGDLGKLCDASRVAALIDAARVPMSSAAKQAISTDPMQLETVLTGGDDYEIVATVPLRALKEFQAAARAARVQVTEIGRVTGGEGVRFRQPVTFTRASFSHF